MKVLSIFFIFIILLSACISEKIPETDPVMQVPSEEEPILSENSKKEESPSIDSSNVPVMKVIREVQFQKAEHNVEGTLKVIEKEGKTFLRFENFKSESGPDLHVRLAMDKEGGQYLDLGKLKSEMGTFEYEVPAGTDIN